MKQKNQQKKIIIDQLLDKSYNYKTDVVKINRHNSEDHEISKFLVCLEIARNGGTFYTEAIFKNGKRADIIDITNLSAIEIIHSETQTRLNAKDYPLPILALSTKKILKKLRNSNNLSL